LRKFFYAAALRPLEPFWGTSDASTFDFQELEYQDDKGRGLGVSRPLEKCLLAILADAFPVPLGFDEIVRAVSEKSRKGQVGEDIDTGQLVEQVAEYLLSLMVRNLCEYYVCPPKLDGSLAERPVCSPIVRSQALGSSIFTNLKHETVETGEFERRLALLLDGSRTLEEVVAALLADVQKGELQLREDGEPVVDPDAQLESLSALVRDGAANLLKSSCLLPHLSSRPEGTSKDSVWQRFGRKLRGGTGS
jgi:methyltransferase-like protein